MSKSESSIDFEVALKKFVESVCHCDVLNGWICQAHQEARELLRLHKEAVENGQAHPRD